MIYVTVGTMYLDFPRLIRAMDDIAQRTDERVVIQTGMGDTIPEHCEHFDFKSREEVLVYQREARLIVCHAGIGAIIDALQSEKPLLVVPRLKKHHEHNSDHQLELAHAVERRSWGRIILDEKDLPPACANPPAAYMNYAAAKQPLLDAIKTDIRDAQQKRD